MEQRLTSARIVSRLANLPICVYDLRDSLTYKPRGSRYRIPKVPLNQRICKICNQNCIEDEFHFIIECITLQGLREQLFLSISLHDASFMHLDNYTKFIYIIQAEHCTAIIAKIMCI